MKYKKPLIAVAVVLVLSALSAMACFYALFYRSVNKTEECCYVYIDNDDTQDSVMAKLGITQSSLTGYRMLLHYDDRVRTGRYVIEPGDGWLTVYRRIRNRQQTPIMLTVPSVRTMPQLASRIAPQLMLDSAEIIQHLQDSTFLDRYGYTLQSVPSLFVPNTYEVYWNMSIEQFMERMQTENRAFWNEEREALAREAGFTHEQVFTIASIVDEETANNGEKPMIAGLYIQRYRTGMRLQADPTVKFAIGDFTLKRIYNTHLTYDSPYNTYMYDGLPPGPIRIPSIVGIDAVLHYVHHDYVYMCAKEDFSGTHNFARTYSEHLANARRYTNALNKLGIR